MENIKIGVFGTFRGLQYIEAINILDGAEVTAICDRDPEKLHDAKAILHKDIKVCETFDELIHSGIDAVILSCRCTVCAWYSRMEERRRQQQANICS